MLVSLDDYKKNRLNVYKTQIKKLANIQKDNFECISNLWNNVQESLNKDK